MRKYSKQLTPKAMVSRTTWIRTILASSPCNLSRCASGELEGLAARCIEDGASEDVLRSQIRQPQMPNHMPQTSLKESIRGAS